MNKRVAYIARMLILLAAVLALPSLAAAATYWSIKTSTVPANLAQAPSTVTLGTSTFGNTVNITDINILSVVFTVTAAPPGYRLTSVTVDGKDVMESDGITPRTTGTFTVLKATNNNALTHNIYATYTEVKSNTFTVKSIATAGGWISPSQTVVNNGTATFTILPNLNSTLDGYYLDPILGAAGKVLSYASFTPLTAGTFTVPNVTAHHSVMAKFTEITSLNAVLSIPPALSIVPGGTLRVVGNSKPAYTTGVEFSWGGTCGLGTIVKSAGQSEIEITAPYFGTCEVNLMVTVNGQNSAVNKATLVATPPVNPCVGCHDGVGGPDNSSYVTSRHNTSTRPDRPTCQTCHNPGGNLSHAYRPLSELPAVCDTCHTAERALHLFNIAIGTNPCTTCHDSHSLAASGGAGMSGPPHFNSITSGTYPASYMTSKASCSNCHVAGAANNTTRLEWKDTGHANTASSAWIGEDFKTRATCVRCHTTTGFIAYSSAKVTAAWGVSTDKSKEMLTCVGCHSDVAAGTVRTVTPNKPFASETVFTNHSVGTSNICMNCHGGTDNGNFIQAKVGTANFANYAFQYASHYMTAGGSLQGKTGFNFIGRTYATYSANSHSKIGMADSMGTGTAGPCVSCHMSTAANHSLKVISESNGAISAITTNICANCHKTSLPAATLDAKRVAFNNALEILRIQLADKGFTWNSTAATFHAGATATVAANWGAGQAGANIMGAAHNYKLFITEPGAYVHNPAYAKQLLTDSIDAAANGGTVSGGIDAALSILLGKGLISNAQISSINSYKQSDSSCNSCHGNPPTVTASGAIHTSSTNCTACHTYTGPGGVTHINGTVDVSITCTSCHGYPPASFSHVTATTSPLNCVNCHTTFSGFDGITHNNGTVDVTPLSCSSCHGNPPGTQTIHTTGFVKYTHNQPAITYSNCSQCHTTPAASAATATHANGTVDLLITVTACNSCHTSPPTTANHPVAATLVPYTCSGCHTDSTAATHNDGNINFSGSLTCNTCHGYPPLPLAQLNGRTGGAFVSAKVEDYPGGGGHHATHLLSTVTANDAFTPCLPCHPNSYHAQGGGSIVRANINVNDVADLAFRFDETRAKRYNTATMSCSNVSCHYQPTAAW